jgi:hypothetical protein
LSIGKKMRFATFVKGKKSGKAGSQRRLVMGRMLKGSSGTAEVGLVRPVQNHHTGLPFLRREFNAHFNVDGVYE